MKYIIMWYDQESVKKTDIIKADSKEEARDKAYMKYNGNPPAPLLSIEEEK